MNETAKKETKRNEKTSNYDDRLAPHEIGGMHCLTGVWYNKKQIYNVSQKLVE